MVRGTELQLTIPDPCGFIPYLREIEALDMLVMITFFKLFASSQLGFSLVMCDCTALKGVTALSW